MVIINTIHSSSDTSCGGLSGTFRTGSCELISVSYKFTKCQRKIYRSLKDLSIRPPHHFIYLSYDSREPRSCKNVCASSQLYSSHQVNKFTNVSRKITYSHFTVVLFT